MSDIRAEILEKTKDAFDFLDEVASAIREEVEANGPDFLTPFTDAVVDATEALDDLRSIVRSPDELEGILSTFRKNS